MFRFRSLKLWVKLAIFAFILGVPLIGTSGRLISARLVELDLFETQQAGIAYLSQVRKLIQLVAEHRGMTYALRNGDSSFGTESLQKRALIENEIESLQRTDQGNASLLSSSTQWQTFTTNWASLQSHTGTADENFAEHSALVGTLQQLTREVADKSNLFVSFDEASYYLAEIVTSRSPALVESLGLLRGKAAGLAAGEITSADRIALAVLMRDVEVQQAQLSESFSALARHHTIPQQLRDADSNQHRAISRFTRVVEDRLINGDGRIAPAEIFRLGTEAIGTSFTHYDGLLAAYDEKVGAGIDELISRLTKGSMQLTLIALAAMTVMWLLLQSILKPLREAVDVAGAIADGDLSRQLNIDTDATDEMSDLLQSSQKMQHRLSDVVENIRTSSDTVVHAANQVKDGNMHLSQQTQEQASSLQDIAASINQMTAFLADNAGHATDAAKIASESRSQADQGGEVVGRAITAMDEVSSSSKQIQEIIGVIDDIAFQTNLLALNAAVEAARAGDMGKGFAVVAGEVQSLSGRSAQAAREIKELIDETRQRIAVGHQHVNESGEVFNQIAQNVVGLGTMISEIADASREQADRLRQVNDSVNAIDGMTQQNAALVEEAASSAETMEAQAKSLLETVEFFSVGKTEATLPVPRPLVQPEPVIDRQPAFAPRLARIPATAEA